MAEMMKGNIAIAEAAVRAGVRLYARSWRRFRTGRK